MKNTTIEGVIFDFNGVLTIFKLEKWIFPIYKAIVKKLKCKKPWLKYKKYPWTREVIAFRAWYTTDWKRSYTDMNIPEDKWEEANKDIFFPLFEKYTKNEKVHPFLETMIQMIERKNMKLGIVSSNKKEDIEKKLGDLAKHFYIVGYNEVEGKHKPAPHGLLLCAEKLGLSPEKCSYLGDDYKDAQASMAAGFKYFIGTGWGIRTKKEFEKYDNITVDFFLNKPKDLLRLLDMIS